MKHTVLHRKHELLKAKMTEFQGWQTPLQFSDVQEEYSAVRAAAGLFDIGYLGRIEVRGPGAAALLQQVSTRSVAKLAEGSVLYTLLCSAVGGILADVLLYRLPDTGSSRRFLVTTNAANADATAAWLRKHAGSGDEVTVLTSSLAQFALQGPRSQAMLELLSNGHFKRIPARTVRELPLQDATVLVSRTGFTGEHGYELFAPADHAEPLWDALLEQGREKGLLPCGLASRDVLRLESGYLQYGSDIDETRNPYEAGLGSFVDLRKDFIGKEALAKIKAEGTKEKLAGFMLVDKGVPKAGGSIFSESREIGTVTSGVQSLRFRKGIGFGYVVSRYAQPGQEIEIEVRDREIAAKIVEMPFYRKK